MVSTVLGRKTFLGVSYSLWHDPRTWLMLLAIMEKNIFRYFMLVLNMITGIEGIGDFVLHISYIVLIILCLQRGCKLRPWDFFIMSFVVIAIIVTWAIYPDNIEKYMIGKDQFWPVVFPLFRYFIVGLFLIPNDESVCLMGKVSCVAIFVESLFVYFILRNSELQRNDDMSRAYFILLNVMLVINYAFDKKSTLGILFSVIGLFFLASMGTRGPVIISLAFLALKVVQSSMNNGRGLIAIGGVILLIWFVNSSFWVGFLLFVQNLIEQMGLSTRVIDMTIQEETLTYMSERDEIADVVIRKISERPLTGWGVYGEWQFVNWSAHNMYLEILDHYGVLLGGCIILWLIFINIKAFFTTKITSVRGLVMLLSCFVLVRGVFGGGFLTFPTFLMIGFCLQVIRKTNFRYF